MSTARVSSQHNRHHPTQGRAGARGKVANQSFSANARFRKRVHTKRVHTAPKVGVHIPVASVTDKIALFGCNVRCLTGEQHV